MTHMRAIFIRHGESTGNAGVPCHDLAAIELTERGHEQARQVAASWTQAPALIVTSPYTRTRQTAAPTIARFPGVPVDVSTVAVSSPVVHPPRSTTSPRPKLGNHPRCTANTRISISPTQNVGRLKPRIDAVITIRSRRDPGWVPAARPSGTPKSPTA